MMPLETCQISADSASSVGRRGRRLVEKLLESTLFKGYQAAFRGATGLSLTLRSVEAGENAGFGESLGRARLCELLADSAQGCRNCMQMQAALEREAALGPQSLYCFTGLCDSAVPLRVGDKLIAFLYTGQVLLHQPTPEEWAKTECQLLAWGSELDLTAVERAYFQAKVFDREQYDSMLRLLAVFAEHLAVVSNSIELKDEEMEPKLVSQAKRYIQGHYSERISLDEAAQAVNASPRHFCKVFKSTTGITFTDYLARVRIEEAKHLLQNPHLRVSEIAFETGFDSISQFNRSFKRIAGQSPTQFRGA